MLHHFIKELILESKLSDLILKYPDHVDQINDLFVEPKYLDWCVKILVNAPDIEQETIVDEINSEVNKFDELCKKKRITGQDSDINRYKSLGDLRFKTQELSGKQTRGDIKREMKTDNEAPLIYEDDRFWIINPQTKRASGKYGAGTKWCISSSEFENKFVSYSVQNIRFYFIFDKNLKYPDPLRVFALCLYPRERRFSVYDANDEVEEVDEMQGSDPKKFYTHLGDRKDVIMGACKSHNDSMGDTIYSQLKNTKDRRLIDKFIKIGVEDELGVLLDNQNLTHVDLEEIDKKIFDSEIKLRLSNHPNLKKNSNLYRKLEILRDFVAEIQSSNDPEFLGRAFEDINEKDIFCFKLLAQNVYCSQKLLTNLSTNKNPSVRQFVGLNTSSPPEILIRLSTDKNIGVKCIIASSTKVPFKVLINLSTDEDPNVRSNVAENINTPSDVLIKLSTDEDPFVRRYVALNMSAPPEVLYRLMKDEDSFVSVEAEQTLKELGYKV